MQVWNNRNQHKERWFTTCIFLEEFYIFSVKCWIKNCVITIYIILFIVYYKLLVFVLIMIRINHFDCLSITITSITCITNSNTMVIINITVSRTKITLLVLTIISNSIIDLY